MNNYDMCFSIGPACRPSYYIRNYGYRKCAYPMDWMMCSIDGTLNLYKKKFKNFFMDYTDISDSFPCQKGRKCLLDNLYGIKDMHHFSSDFDIESQLNNYRATMQRRYNRFESDIREATSVLIMSNYTEDFEKLKCFIVDFSIIYPNKKIKLVNVHTVDQPVFKKITHKINDLLSIDEYFFNDTNKYGDDPATNPAFWIGNEEMWLNIIQEYMANVD